MTLIDNGLTDNWALVSQSNHDVLTDGADWMKVAYDDSVKAKQMIEVEAQIFDAIGIDVMRTEHKGRPAHLTPFLGTTVDPNDFAPHTVLDLMDRLWSSVPVEALNIPQSHQFAEIVQQRVVNRVQYRGFRLELLSHLPENDSFVPGTQIGLCHTDLHTSNILESTDGLVIIDWESAMYGPRAIYRASLMYSLWLTKRYEAALLLKEYSFEAQNFVLTKAVSAASWTYPRFGYEESERRLEAGTALVDAMTHDV